MKVLFSLVLIASLIGRASANDEWVALRYAYADPSIEVEQAELEASGNIRLSGLDGRDLANQAEAKATVDNVQWLLKHGTSYVIVGLEPDKLGNPDWVEGLRNWAVLAQQHKLPYRVGLYDSERSDWEYVHYYERLEGGQELIVESMEKMQLRNGNLIEFSGNLPAFKAYLKGKISAGDSGRIDFRIRLKRNSLKERHVLRDLTDLLRVLNENSRSVYYQVWLENKI